MQGVVALIAASRLNFVWNPVEILIEHALRISSPIRHSDTSGPRLSLSRSLSLALSLSLSLSLSRSLSLVDVVAESVPASLPSEEV